MVKLSYYFPVSSDSVALKRQLLESGVLDKTNETMYRMAPEAVDPSILSRGSLSFRRYTRSALLMLRNDKLSRKRPNCLKDLHLLRFSFWKLNDNFKTIDESRNATSTSNSAYDEHSLNKYHINNSSNHSMKNPIGKYSNPVNNRAINDQTHFKYDSREGRFVEKCNKFNKDFVNANNNDSDGSSHLIHRGNGHQNKPKNLNHNNYQSFYMMSSLVQQKYEPNEIRNKPVTIRENNENENYNNLLRNNDSDNINEETAAFSLHKNQNDIRDQIKTYDNTSEGNVTFSNSEKNNMKRYGSGRLSFYNKNWKKFDFSANSSKNYSDFNHKNKNTMNIYHNYNNNYYYQNRYRKDSASSSVQSYNSEEPEWLSCGPTSKNDVIELRGFDDDPASDKEDEKTCDLNLKKETNELTLPEKNLKASGSDFEIGNDNVKKQAKLSLSTTKSSNVAIKKDQESVNNSLISASNYEVQSDCTSTVPSPPPARSTPTKLLNFNINSNCHNSKKNYQKITNNNNQQNFSNAGTDNNKKNYYSLQFNFDNFLDYDTITNILSNNSKSKSTHWFPNHHTALLHQKCDINSTPSVMTQKKPFRQQDRVPKNVINVNDLENEMRKQTVLNIQQNNQEKHNRSQSQSSPIIASVNAFTQSAYKQMLVQANAIVKQAQDPEVFRRFLEQVNSVNQLTALSQFSKPLLLQQPLLPNNNGGQKRIPTTRELEFHTRNIVQNALFRKHLQEQQKRRLQELQQITLQSNINPNAPEFTPTSVLRQMSVEKENVSLTSFRNENFNNIFSHEEKNLLFNKPKSFSDQKSHQIFSQLNMQQNSRFQTTLQQNDQNKASSNTDNTNNLINSGRIGEKHIKWDNNFLHYTPNNKQPTGRPILKGSNTISSLKTPMYSSSIFQNQIQEQNEVQHYGFDYFLKSKYGNTHNYNTGSRHESSVVPNWYQQQRFDSKQQIFKSNPKNSEDLNQFPPNHEQSSNDDQQAKKEI